MLRPKKKRYTTVKTYQERINLTNEVLFGRIDRMVREKKLYLEHRLSINDLADLLGTNRTYISRAMKSHAGGFVNYITRVRVESLHDYILRADREGRLLEDGEDLAQNTGFTNKRAMQRAVKKVDGISLRELNKSRAQRNK